jgi:hypothetical protein
MERRVLNFITGSGIGALVAFFIVVLYFPSSVSTETSFLTMLSGIIVGGTLFDFTRWKFLAAPISYLCGLGAVLVLIALGLITENFPGGTILVLIVLSLVPLYFFRPVSVIDALLSGPEYFGGATTGLAIGGILDLLTLGTAFGTTFIGAIGALGAFAVSSLALAASFRVRSNLKPKP